MGSTFLSPPAKRTKHHAAAAMPDPFHNYDSTLNGSSNMRSKRPPSSSSPLPIPPGHVSFRLLCHASRIGGVIGKSGSIIKNLQQSTGAKIRVEDPPAESPDRVVTVIAAGEGEVSKAQEALVRVFERILEVAAEGDGVGAGGGVVSCRLLAEAREVGSVIGKGGKVVEKIRKDFGVKIRALTDNLPVCAGSTDEIVEVG